VRYQRLDWAGIETAGDVGEAPWRRSWETDVARIAGVNIPTQKRVVIALQYIRGIGPKLAKEVCSKAGIPEERRVNQLTDAEVLQIRETIDRDYAVEGDLRRDVIPGRCAASNYDVQLHI